MPLYTARELAQICQVINTSVYSCEEEGIIVPSDYAEDGSGLYTEADVVTVEKYCFLRGLGLSLRDVKNIMNSDEADSAIELLLREQLEWLNRDFEYTSDQIQRTYVLSRKLYPLIKQSGQEPCSRTKSEPNEKMYTDMMNRLIPLELVGFILFVFGILCRVWVPFCVVFLFRIACMLFYAEFCYEQTEYICSKCRRQFRHKRLEAVFLKHSPKMRRLKCPRCKQKIWSMEVES